jgi:hypothetical protein
LPGTINVLSPKKRLTGRKPAVAKVLPEFSSRRRYTLTELSDWMPPVQPQTLADGTVASKIDMAVVEETDSYDSLPAALRDKLETNSKRRPRLARLWTGEDAPGDGSPSARAWALSGELRQTGEFDITEFAQLVSTWEFRSVKHAHDFERYVSRAWNRNPAPLGGKDFERRQIVKHPTTALTIGEVGSDVTLASSDKPRHVRAASPVIAFDEVALAPRPWILANLACRGLVSIVTGLSGASKSTYSFPVALAAITGRDDIAGFHVRERTRVWMWNQEDDLAEMQRRLLAAMRTFNVSWDDLRDENGEPMLYMDSGIEAPLMLAVKQDKAIRGTRDVAAVIDTVRERKIGLLMLDPLVEFHEADENANMEMRAVIGCVRSITAGTGCAGIVVAHTGKPPAASSKSFAGNPNAIRGAYAQVGTARIVATVYAAAKEDEKEWILPGGVENYVRVDIAKNNIGPRPTVWLKREMQMIGGEPVAMVRPAPVQRKVKEGKPDALAGFARVLATMKAFDRPTPLASLLDQVAELNAEDKTALGTYRTRTRWLDAAFGGKAVNEWLTDSGLVVRSAGKGKVGTLLTLAPPADSNSTDAPGSAA